MKGTLYGVGAGPGDPELITHKAFRIITSCRVIAVPGTGKDESVAFNIVRQAIPSIERKRLILLDMPMTRDENELCIAHQHAADTIADVLDKGINVAFLTLGDPTIYSTYIYVHRLIRRRGYKAVIIPGVTSFCAAAARLGDCLAETDQPLCIIPGSYGDISSLLALGGTKVIMKSGKSFDEVRDQITRTAAYREVRIVENCGLPGERVHETLKQDENSPGYFTVIILKD